MKLIKVQVLAQALAPASFEFHCCVIVTTKTKIITLLRFLIINYKSILGTRDNAKSGLHKARARNNFRIASGHDDRPNSFLLGHVLFLAGQMYMMNYSFRGP